MFCPKCGQRIADGEERCSQCGTVISSFTSSWLAGSSRGSLASGDASDGGGRGRGLERGVYEALNDWGVDVLHNQGRVKSYVLDAAGEDDRNAAIFSKHYDDELSEVFYRAATERTASAMQVAESKATMVLVDEWSIESERSREVSNAVTCAIARFVGVPYERMGRVDKQPKDHQGKRQDKTPDGPDEEYVVCPRCHRENSVRHKFCSKCGFRLIPQEGPKTDGAGGGTGRGGDTGRGGGTGSGGGGTGRGSGGNGSGGTGSGGRQPLIALAVVLLVAVIAVGAFLLNQNGGTGKSSASDSAHAQSSTSTVTSEDAGDDASSSASDDTSDGAGDDASSSGAASSDKAGTAGEEQSGTEQKASSDDSSKTVAGTQGADVTPKEEKHDPPKFTRAEASSSGDDVGDTTYVPACALDGDLLTGWSEGVDGYGEGEWLELRADEAQYVSGIQVLNGYTKSKELYFSNSRPKDIRIELDDWSMETTLEDKYSEGADPNDPSTSGWQTITFPEAHMTKRVRVTILSVYTEQHMFGGNGWPDTTISELRAF